MKLAIQRIYFSLLAGAPTALQTLLFIDLKRIYFKTILNPTKETQEADFPN